MKSKRFQNLQNMTFSNHLSMKKNYYTRFTLLGVLLLLTIGFTPRLQAQGTSTKVRLNSAKYFNPCRIAISQLRFNKKKQEIQRAQKGRKLSVAQRVARNNCLKSRQVKEIAQLFFKDQNRFEFAKTAYLKTVDRRNYKMVLTTFFDRNYRNRLKNYMAKVDRNQGNTGNNGTRKNKNGKKRWRAISTSEFNQILRSVKNQSYEAKRFPTAKRLMKAKKKRLTVAQVRTIAKNFSYESTQLSFVKFAYDYALRPRNYHKLVTLFSTDPRRRDFLRFYRGKWHKVPVEKGNGQLVSQQVYGQVANSIRRKKFGSEKLTAARKNFRTKARNKKFTINQIRFMARLFDADRMTFLKFAYDYAYRPQNYNKLVSLFKFSSDRDDLKRFIKSRK